MPDLDIEKLLLFLVFVVPGFVALKVYDLLIPAERRDFSSSIVEVISFSMVNLAIMSWAILLLIKGQFYKEHQTLFLLSAVGILFVTPAGLAILVY